VKLLLAILYGLVTRLRNWLYDVGILPRYGVNIPVISVGNVTAGGNGKTPLCIFLARELSQRGWRPVILSRGYGGSESGPHLVSADDSPARVGDEPSLMTRLYGLTVVVSRDRVAGARLIEAERIGDLVILDDGFQHRRLRRTLDIVTVNTGDEGARRSFVEGALLPLGRFREARDPAMRRVDILVLSERQPADAALPVDPALRGLVPVRVPVVRSSLRVSGVVSADEGAPLTGRAVVAFCGIANPESFFVTLQREGCRVEGRTVYPDHHRFSEADLDALRGAWPGLPLVCTEKDIIKLDGMDRRGIFVVRTELHVFPGDSFLRAVTEAISVSDQNSAES